MMAVDPIAAASHRIGQALYVAAVQLSEPFKEDPRALASVLFGAGVVGLSHTLTALVGIKKTREEQMKILVAVHNELTEAAKNIAIKHAESGFSVMVVDPLIKPPSDGKRFEV